ncbi:MAG TPA: phosphoribosylformylglycinamidine synthase subunit PurS [Candidatus Sulfotelmatobacter sp.]|nr:phosphoribosylformylglycinamidine synthase subunit PurS [Candidatus Sulfotelmatobacter sp.]
MFEARVYVTLKQGVLDPQGDTVRSALEALGFAGVGDVRIGKFMVLTLNGASRAEAEAQVHAMCRQLLANPVIEDYRFDLADAPASSPSPPPGEGTGEGVRPAPKMRAGGT